MLHIAFLAPWILAALPALPVLFLLMRITPPPPRRLAFPPVRFLEGLAGTEPEAARTPWWILALRVLTVLLIVLGLAHPVLESKSAITRGPGSIVLAIDNGFTAAPDWETRMAVADALLDRAERTASQVLLLPTAPPAEGGPVAASPPLQAGEARKRVRSLRPMPWPTDRTAAVTALEGIVQKTRGRAFWISDGIEDGPRAGSATALATALQRIGDLDVLEAPVPPVRLLTQPRFQDGTVVVSVRRPLPSPRAVSSGASALWVRAFDDSGHVVARSPVAWTEERGEAVVRLELPPELGNRLGRIDLEGMDSVAGKILLDPGRRRPTVGLMAGNASGTNLPLLGDLYYLERALSPLASVREGDVTTLLERKVSLLVLADVARITDGDGAAIDRWMRENGGVLVRFSGPSLADTAGEDPLLPVPLRRGGRNIGGALSWEQPQTLAAFPSDSPFAGLRPPREVRVFTQVLAEPTPELAAKTWARLSDGTPLVTAERRGLGWVVLVHTTANAEWSNLALSGLYVEMLERLLTLSGNAIQGSGEVASRPLPPLELLDGFGRSRAPDGTDRPIDGNALASVIIGPGHPPGTYGTPGQRHALNLSDRVTALLPIQDLPAGVGRHDFAGATRDYDLKPWLLALALLLASVDGIAALILRRRSEFSGPRKKEAPLAPPSLLGMILSGMILSVSPAEAADDSFALSAALHTRLAYVKTGNAAVDDISRRGLGTLTRVLAERSAAVLDEPMAIDPERDPLSFFPLLYWPVVETADPPSPEAGRRITDYMNHGGMILVDTRDADGLFGMGGRRDGDGPSLATL
ncbi:MAG: DUF4159 domain-containing protein, partial [Alphaproteobacteria bacterium]